MFSVFRVGTVVRGEGVEDRELGILTDRHRITG